MCPWGTEVEEEDAGKQGQEADMARCRRAASERTGNLGPLCGGPRDFSSRRQCSIGKSLHSGSTSSCRPVRSPGRSKPLCLILSNIQVSLGAWRASCIREEAQHRPESPLQSAFLAHSGESEKLDKRILPPSAFLAHSSASIQHS